MSVNVIGGIIYQHCAIALYNIHTFGQQRVSQRNEIVSDLVSIVCQLLIVHFCKKNLNIHKTNFYQQKFFICFEKFHYLLQKETLFDDVVSFAKRNHNPLLDYLLLSDFHQVY